MNALHAVRADRPGLLVAEVGVSQEAARLRSVYADAPQGAVLDLSVEPTADYLDPVGVYLTEADVDTLLLALEPYGTGGLRVTTDGRPRFVPRPAGGAVAVPVGERVLITTSTIREVEGRSGRVLTNTARALRGFPYVIRTDCGHTVYASAVVAEVAP